MTIKANVYDIGDLVRLSAIFKVLEVETDPSTVTVRIIDPSGVKEVLTYADEEVTRDTTGRYHYDLLITESGYWSYRWEGTGAVVTAAEARLYVRSSKFTETESA